MYHLRILKVLKTSLEYSIFIRMSGKEVCLYTFNIPKEKEHIAFVANKHFEYAVKRTHSVRLPEWGRWEG